MGIMSLNAIFFDAGGTLFEVRGSVGKIYSDVALRHGIHIDPKTLDVIFRKEFAAKSSMGFPANAAGNLPRAERLWWLELVQRVLPDFFPAELVKPYFDELYSFFCSAEAWHLFPDAEETLTQLKRRGYRLGVISNFDTRLKEILTKLRIGFLFDHVTISWEAGAAKPEVKIFHDALKAMNISPDQALHVGDSIQEDFEGARAAGLTSILLDRLDNHPGWKDGLRIRSLAELCRLLW